MVKSMQLADLIGMMRNFKEHRQEIAKKATLVREQTRRRLQQGQLPPAPGPAPARPALPAGVSTRKMISVRRLQTLRGPLLLQQSPRDLSASAAAEERKLVQIAFDSKRPFEDADFPAAMQSVFPKPGTSPDVAKVVATEWKRPSQLAKTPQLFVDDINQGDVMQGALGDCWFVSALAVLAQFGPDLLRGLFVSSHPAEGLYVGSFVACDREVSPVSTAIKFASSLMGLGE